MITSCMSASQGSFMLSWLPAGPCWLVMQGSFLLDTWLLWALEHMAQPCLATISIFNLSLPIYVLSLKLAISILSSRMQLV